MLVKIMRRTAVLSTGAVLALSLTACSAAKDGEIAEDPNATGGGFMGTGGAMPGVGGGSPAGGSGAGSATGGSGAGSATGGGGAVGPVACSSPEDETFSFFLISRAATLRESNSPDGFGGDLGGLAGADAVCQRVAQYVSPCQVNKTWRAFLSTSTEDAIDRIGQGPWHDRIGRLLANNVSELLNDRPINADPEILNDLPNEYGVPNHNPDGTGLVDNHQILTGSGTDGRLYAQSSGGQRPGMGTACGTDRGDWTAEKATCRDWTSSEPWGCPRVGQSWPRTDMPTESSWISYYNEGGCAPGGELADDTNDPEGLDGTPRVGSAGGYGGWYCFAVMP